MGSNSDSFFFATLSSSDGSGESAGGGGIGGGLCNGGGGRAGNGHLTCVGGEDPLDRSVLRFTESPADLTYELERNRGGLPSTEGDLESLDIVGGDGRGRGGLEAGFSFAGLFADGTEPGCLCIFSGW